jgi:hypothetical protein
MRDAAEQPMQSLVAKSLGRFQLSRRRFICVAALTMLMGSTLGAFWPREPSYEGYPLSSWLQIGYGTGMTHGDGIETTRIPP